MALSALNKAKEAEALAEEQIKCAEAEAKQIQQRSVQDASAYRERVIEEAKKEAAKILKEASSTADSEIEAKKKMVALERESIKASSKSSVASACDRVVERIVMSYGNS